MQGGLFAADSPYYGWVIPAVGHTVAIGTLNNIYKTVAEKCTNYENHRFKACMLSCVQNGSFTVFNVLSGLLKIGRIPSLGKESYLRH